MEGKVSRVQMSTLFTRTAASKHDPRQTVPEFYDVPSEEVRMLLARLVTEEYLELITALGFNLRPINGPEIESMKNAGLVPRIAWKPDLEAVIDAACDSIYVNTNVLTACGAPDLPHLEAVCKANEAKFPNGVATMDAKTGKYLKPEDWTPPNHKEIAEYLDKEINYDRLNSLRDVGENIVASTTMKDPK